MLINDPVVRNKVADIKQAPGFVIVNGSVVREMIGNAADSNQGPPRFVLGRDATVGETGASNL